MAPDDDKYPMLDSGGKGQTMITPRHSPNEYLETHVVLRPAE